MKLFYNTASLKPPCAGIGRYTQCIMAGMLKQPGVAKVVGVDEGNILSAAALQHRLNTFSLNESAGTTSLLKIKLKLKHIVRAMPMAYRLRWAMNEVLSYKARRLFARQDFIYHETNFLPLGYAGKTIVTIHDLSHIRYPEYHPVERVSFLNRCLPDVVQRVDKIITVSEFSRQEILQHFNLSPQKVVAIWNGVDASFKVREEAEIQPILDRYKLKYKRYILSVATLEPRKNFARLLKAFVLLSPELRQAYPLVLVGGKGWKDQEIFKLAEPLIRSGHLIVTGYVSGQELPAVYSGAYLFAYPSVYEGFGLPVVEAMASGVPVLTSNTSSLSEVSGGGALEINPFSVEAIADGLTYLLTDAEGAKKYRQKGLLRAKDFSWIDCIEKTLAVYHSMV